MYYLRYTRRFKRDLARCKKAGLDLEELWSVVEILVEKGTLPEGCNPHRLKDEYAGCWECHIDDDWLLVWRQNDERLTLLLTNTGTHQDLFAAK